MVDEIKKLHRTDFLPEDWYRYNACDSFFCEYAFNTTESIDRQEASTLSPATFSQYYEIPNRPVIISGGISHWPAFEKWTIPVSHK